MIKRKNKTGTYRSRLSAAIHETAAGLHRFGLMDKETMREFDASCLTAVEPLSAKEIVAIRKRAGVSQRVFAHYLNVKPPLVIEFARRVHCARASSEGMARVVELRGTG
jgi:putative transcriptional regulator